MRNMWQKVRREQMSELKFCPLCGGNMKLEKIIETHGMDGSYSNWKLSCTKCGIIKKYAADGFYGREYYSTKEEVIDDWNELSETEIKSMTKEQNYMRGYRDGNSDVLDKIKGYVDHIRYTSMGKNKSLEYIEKFIERLAKSEDKQ